MSQLERTIMSFDDIVVACQLNRIHAEADVSRPLFLGMEIEYCGKPLTHSKLRQIMRSHTRLNSIRERTK
jgi:hypothetical protein